MALKLNALQLKLKARSLVSLCRSLHFGSRLSESFGSSVTGEDLQRFSVAEVESNEDALLCLAALTPLGRPASRLVAELVRDTTARNSGDLGLFREAVSGVRDRETARALRPLAEDIASSVEFCSPADQMTLLRAFHRLKRFDLDLNGPKDFRLEQISDLHACEQLAILGELGELQSQWKHVEGLLRKISEIEDPTLEEISMVLSVAHVGKIRSEISSWLNRHIGRFVDKFPIRVFAQAARYAGEELDSAPTLADLVFARLEKFPGELAVRDLERHVFSYLSFSRRSEIFSNLISGKPLAGAGVGFLCAAAESEISPPEISRHASAVYEKFPADLVARLALLRPEVELGLDRPRLLEILKQKISSVSDSLAVRLCLAGHKLPAVRMKKSEIFSVATAIGQGDEFRAKLAMIDLVENGGAGDEIVQTLLRETAAEDGPLGVFTLTRNFLVSQ